MQLDISMTCLSRTARAGTVTMPDRLSTEGASQLAAIGDLIQLRHQVGKGVILITAATERGCIAGRFFFGPS